ncbi:helix-turn-helix domain-containing protein [Mycobacterium sp.]|uniref:helix-turn-helix domain-containing protein n=1 Tax=Mycobacterium sp. TaxID=1785 RepID=UPI00260573AB|nr:helix-turn-helix domain-containing protein [Mycobacterium sp.]
MLTYGKHGLSIATSAKDLHPNTVTYRQDRWQHLTGWNPRSLDGLLNSVVGLNLYPTDTGGAEANRTGGAGGRRDASTAIQVLGRPPAFPPTGTSGQRYRYS